MENALRNPHWNSLTSADVGILDNSGAEEDVLPPQSQPNLRPSTSHAHYVGHSDSSPSHAFDFIPPLTNHLPPLPGQVFPPSSLRASMAAVRRSAIGPITHSLEWPPLPASTLSRVFEPTTVAAASHTFGAYGNPVEGDWSPWTPHPLSSTYDYWSPGGCLPQTVHSPASDSGSGSSGATTPLADYYYQQQQQQQQQQQAFHPQPHIMLQDEEDDFSPPNSVGSSQHSTPALGAIPLPTAPLSDKHQAILSSFKSPTTDIPNTTVPPRSENERYHCTECSKTLLGFDAETRHKAWHHLQERRRRIQRHESQEHKSDTSPQTGHKSYVACNFCRFRKIRCDSTRPSCGQCSRRDRQCLYGFDSKKARNEKDGQPKSQGGTLSRRSGALQKERKGKPY